VDTYSIPSYKEINPAIFTTVTFPFLFGVMFGDIFHGALLLAFATYLLWYRHPSPTSLMALLLKLRYLFLLLGLFSLYCGLVYNDFTSIPLALFS
jgi:V-type H+-transporting ATPase subunit a